MPRDAAGIGLAKLQKHSTAPDWSSKWEGEIEMENGNVRPSGRLLAGTPLFLSGLR